MRALRDRPRSQSEDEGERADRGQDESALHDSSTTAAAKGFPDLAAGTPRTCGEMRILCALFAMCGPLAAEPLPDGGRLILDSRPDGSGAGPCLAIRGLPGGPRGCARAPSERVPSVRRAISASAIVRAARRGPVELWGETGPRVREVIVRYAGPWRRERAVRATLLQARDPWALAANGIRRPFGVFHARIPGKARVARADASAGPPAGRGRRLGSASFSRLLADPHLQRSFLMAGP